MCWFYCLLLFIFLLSSTNLKLEKQKTFAGKRFDQFAHSGKEGVPQSMCTIINCSKGNSSLLLSKDSLPTKHLRSSKLFQFVTTQAPKPWGKSLYILDLCILETTTIGWQGESLRKCSNSSDSSAHPSAEQAAAAAFSQQAAPWKIWDNSRSFLLESSLSKIKIWGRGEAQISFCEKKMLLKTDTRNFVPHLYFQYGSFTITFIFWWISSSNVSGMLSFPDSRSL